MSRQKYDWGKVIPVIIRAVIEGEAAPTWRSLSDKFEIPYQTIQEAFKREMGMRAKHLENLVNEGEEEEEKFRSTLSINGEGVVLSERLIAMSQEDAKSPERVMELHGFDPEEWDLIDVVNNFWEMMKSYKIGGGTQILYQSKIRLKPKNPNEITLKKIDDWFKNFEPAQTAEKVKPYSTEGCVLEVDFADLHFGKAGAEEALPKVIDDIVSRAKGRKFSEILLILPGDTFHFDTYERTTTSGTRIETGMTHQEMFDLTQELLIATIDRLRKIAPVKVYITPGNHDYKTAYTFAKTLEAYYRKTDVYIDTGHAPRKYYHFGNVLIGWAHGNIAKKNLDSFLLNEAREEFGKSKFVHVHSGHIHKEKMDTTEGGIEVWHLPTITKTDQWHEEKGYTGAPRSTVCFVWDAELGERERWKTTV